MSEVTKMVNKEEIFLANYDFDAAFDKVDEKVKRNHFEAAALITLRANLYRNQQMGKTKEELQTIANAWLPGVVTRTRGKTKIEKAHDAYNSLDEEEKADMAKFIAERLREAKAARASRT